MEKDNLKERLSELQWRVTQEAATEPAYSSEFIRNSAKGKYFCVVCGCELFDTDGQNFNECAWPSFCRQTEENNIMESLQNARKGKNNIEVKCKMCNSHLGHVFYNGRGRTGRNYCINGAALSFL